MSTESLYRLDRIRQMPKFLPELERVTLTVESVQKGGYVKVDGVIYQVTAKHRYYETWKEKGKVKSCEWFELELESIRTGEKTYLEYERDDELELSMWQKDISLRRIGVTRSQLDEFDDEEEGDFRFDGRNYEYDDSGEATFYRNCTGEGENFYYWDFEDSSGHNFIGCEKWGDGSYNACVGHEPRRVEVLHTGKE